MRYCERTLRGRRARLPDLEMDHHVTRRFLLGRGGHHVHDDEWIDASRTARKLTCHVAVY